jgi:hypothetical protein
MTTAGDLQILNECHREKLAMRQRHVAVARLVTDYNFNNAYQYVINREDVHLSWLEAAITELGGTPASMPEPSLTARRGKGKDAFIGFVAEDVRDAEKFATTWRARLNDVGNARHRTMLQLMCGETLEQKRFFDQMVAGNQDLLGRRSNGAGSPGTGDGVLGVRWIE